MADRLIEIYVPENERERAEAVIRGSAPAWRWTLAAPGQVVYRLLVGANEVEGLLDPLQAALEGARDFRVLVLPVAASLPKPEEPAAPEKPPEKKAGGQRISREELYESLSSQSRITPVFLATVVLSTVVAAIGLSRDNAAVVIGAMVIAPLLGPNVALALATTLGDTALAWRALKANAAGMAVALVAALAAGFLLGLGGLPAGSLPGEIAARSVIHFSDLVLALAAGSAGALAFTAGVPMTVVGVMVAVALLPPLVTCALLLQHGSLAGAGNAALLLATNVICVNLAGVATFLVQGIRPRSWWEAQRSARAARLALAVWALLLLAVACLVFVSQWRRGGVP